MAIQLTKFKAPLYAETLIALTFIALFIITLPKDDTKVPLIITPFSILAGREPNLNNAELYKKINNMACVKLVQENQLINASDLAYKTLQVSPYDLKTLLSAGQVFMELGNYPKGIELLYKALKLAPNNNYIKFYYGEGLLVSGDYLDSLKVLNNLYVRNLCQDPNLEIEISRVYLFLRQYEQAYTHLEKAIAKYPNNGQLNYLSAMCLAKIGSNEEALSDFVKNYKTCYVLPDKVLRFIKGSNGIQEDALKSLIDNIEESPQDIQLRIETINFALFLEKYTLALKLLDNREIQNHSDASFLYAITYAELNQKDVALKYLNIGINQYLNTHPKWNLPCVSIFDHF